MLINQRYLIKASKRTTKLFDKVYYRSFITEQLIDKSSSLVLFTSGIILGAIAGVTIYKFFSKSSANNVPDTILEQKEDVIAELLSDNLGLETKIMFLQRKIELSIIHMDSLVKTIPYIPQVKRCLRPLLEKLFEYRNFLKKIGEDFNTEFGYTTEESLPSVLESFSSLPSLFYLYLLAFSFFFVVCFLLKKNKIKKLFRMLKDIIYKKTIVAPYGFLK